MAYIADTAFEPRIVNNRFDDLANIAGLYQAGGANADCSAGLLCVQAEQVPCEGFAGILNENTWYMNAAGADANIDIPVYACNTYDTKLIGDGRNNWHVGLETLGLGAPAGRYCTYTHIDFDGRSVYRFGIGNLSAELGENTFFTIANGLLVPAAAAPTAAGSIYFELRGTGNFTEGTTSSFQYVDVVAKRVSVAA
jgi:hypothetical protein